MAGCYLPRIQNEKAMEVFAHVPDFLREAKYLLRRLQEMARGVDIDTDYLCYCARYLAHVSSRPCSGMGFW